MGGMPGNVQAWRRARLHLLVAEVGVTTFWPPLQAFLEQYTTNLKHSRSVGAVQADFHSASEWPVQARVRQARVGGRAAIRASTPYLTYLRLVRRLREMLARCESASTPGAVRPCW